MVDGLLKYERQNQIVLSRTSNIKPHNMSGFYEGVGKGTSSRQRSRTSRSNGGGDDRYPARDIRYEVEGQGSRSERSSSQRPRHVPRYTCGTCHDLCCGLARELITTAFGLGKIKMSRWVSEVVPFI